MTANAIRVQLPGGAIYAPALHQAAAKTGARSGLAKRSVKAFNDLVQASVALLNSGESTMITLEMMVHDTSISVKVVGKDFASPTKKSIKALETMADKKASEFAMDETAAACTISFDVP